MAAARTDGVAHDHRSRVAAVVVRHERALLRVARQASLCHDDALDAYQRALEIFVRRVETVDPATEVAWLKVVIRHEAMAIRRARSESVAGEDLDLDTFIPGSDRSVEDQIASGERVRRSAEALRALKPDEAKALMMKAHGLSYDEIGERNGWSYTKVNRAITEGRRRFMRVYEGIESGAECERFAPIVEALAGGAATAAQVLEIRPHLRHCTVCRATVRDLHLSRLRRASLFWPIFIVAEPLGRLGESSPTVEERLQELAGHGAASPPPPDAAVPLPQMFDGGLQLPLELPAAPAEEAVDAGRLGGVRHDISEFFHRANASDVATGAQIAPVRRRWPCGDRRRGARAVPQRRQCRDGLRRGGPRPRVRLSPWVDRRRQGSDAPQASCGQGSRCQIETRSTLRPFYCHRRDDAEPPRALTGSFALGDSSLRPACASTGTQRSRSQRGQARVQLRRRQATRGDCRAPFEARATRIRRRRFVASHV